MTSFPGSSPGYVTGGHVLRLFHGHMDECLTISPADSEDQRRSGMGTRGLGVLGPGGIAPCGWGWGSLSGELVTEPLTSLSLVSPDLSTMKGELCAPTPAPSGDWSR